MPNSQEYKFCTKCGNEVFAEAVICPNCGTQILDDKSDSASKNPNTTKPDFCLIGFKGEIYNNKMLTPVNHYYALDIFFQSDTIYIRLLDENKVIIEKLNVPYSSIIMSTKNVTVALFANCKCLTLKLNDTVLSIMAVIPATKKGLNKLAYFRRLNKITQKSIEDSAPFGYSVSLELLEQFEDELRKRL